MPDQRDSRYRLHRVAGRQHDPSQQDHRRIEEHPPERATTSRRRRTQGETFRFHWDTPMILSPNDPGVLLVAANRVFRSTDRGDSWTVISPDLTIERRPRHDRHDGPQGERHPHLAGTTASRQWPTIVALAESPRQPGVYYTGTDDGVVSMSRDGGKTWQNITADSRDSRPARSSREVVPSRFDAGTVYVTVDNHRLNDFEALHVGEHRLRRRRSARSTATSAARVVGR